MMESLTEHGKAIIMDILKRINLIFLLALCFLCASCTTERQCPNFDADFIIKNWNGPAPTHAELIQYKENSGFRTIEKSSIGLRIKKNYSENMKLHYLQVSTSEWLPVDADYRLILDGSIEYNITNIVSSERGNLGCPLNSAQVNACKAAAFRTIDFDKNCGTPVSANSH